MIDEETLARALAEGADAFAPSPEGPSRILDAAQGASQTAESRLATFWRTPSRARVLLAAAAGVLAVSGIAWPLMRSENPPTTSALKGLHRSPLVISGSGYASATPNASSYTPTDAQNLVTLTGAKLGVRAPKVPTRIASTGSISLHVDTTITRAFDELGALATRDGGSVASSRAQVGRAGVGHFASGTIALRVPQRSFATLVTQVQRLGRATSLVTSSQDVTSAYVDLQARISAEEASRRQYLAIMTRATTINGILAVQQEIDAIQSQIEQLQGQLNVLNAQTTDATLSVDLSSGTRAPAPSHPSGISRAWHDARRGFVGGIEWLIRLSGPALFAVLLLGVLGLLGRVAWRAVRRRV